MTGSLLPFPLSGFIDPNVGSRTRLFRINKSRRSASFTPGFASPLRFLQRSTHVGSERWEKASRQSGVLAAPGRRRPVKRTSVDIQPPYRHRLLSVPVKDGNGQKRPPCLSLFICLCWFISLRLAALFASSLPDSLPPLGIEWPRRPGSKYTPNFT